MNMKENSEFLIINKFKKLIILFENEYLNIPKSDIYLKEKINLIVYEILEILYYTNITKKVDSFNELFTKIKLLDFCIKRSMDKGMISYKKFIVIGNNLNEITRMIYGWKKSEKSPK